MDFDPVPYNFQFSFVGWLQLVGVISVAAILLGIIFSFTSSGAHGGKVFATGLMSFLKEVFTISPRRVMALAGLTLKEAWRRKALLVFVVFAILLMFAGWFLTDRNDRADLQINVHITFMLTTISWLILPVVIFLSCWGLPEDIRVRSLHTVVTKPARRIEVVLGRMIGYMTMGTIILLLMGIAGYVWITRQAPDSLDRDKYMTCRVPVYGALYFFDSKGLPKTVGVNVGDTWMYRSFIEGNSRARAVWLFADVNDEKLGNELRLESRFEAFRTVKGTEDSINEGLEAQYFLIRNPREDVFSSFGVGASFREIGDAFREGEFQNAADLLDSAASRMISAPSDFPVIDCKQVSIACDVQATPGLRSVSDQFGDVADAFAVFGQMAGAVKAEDQTDKYEAMSKACVALAKVIRERGPDLMENMPRLEVPLEPFHVSEYHEGDNFTTYSRKLSYTADYEGTARFLAKAVSELNDQSQLAVDGQLSPTLSDDLVAITTISPINAELVADVLAEQVESEALTIEGNKVAIADGSRWLKFFDGLVRAEKLISQDPAGWTLEADLFDDLAPDGVLRVEVSCLNDQMYLGMARPDLFIRLPDRPFIVGFMKAILNIGLMLALVTVLGVTASTIVKGPVSFFFTLTVFVIGQFFHPMMLRIIYGQEEGGGTLASAIMIFQHRNPSIGIDANEGTQNIVQGVDSALTGVLTAASNIIPDFTTFSRASAYIGNGFDVPWSTSILPSIMTFIGFLIPCVIIGAACLKFRELEAK